MARGMNGKKWYTFRVFRVTQKVVIEALDGPFTVSSRQRAEELKYWKAVNCLPYFIYILLYNVLLY